MLGVMGFLTFEEIWNDSKKQEHCVYIEVLYILERQFWKVKAGVSGFLTLENIWHDW
jgi:hypothetical protein